MSSTCIWKEFPDINRKVAFMVSSSVMEGTGTLGCHTGSIQHVKVWYAGTDYHYCSALNDPCGEWIKVIDPLKGPPVAWKDKGYHDMNSYRYRPYWTVDDSELRLLSDYFNKIDLGVEHFGAEVFEGVITQCRTRPLWFISDVINWDSQSRNGGKDGNTPFHPPQEGALTTTLFLRTRDFVKYLKDNNKGFLMSSPIVQNPNHRGWGLYSLNQGWIWIPEEHICRSVLSDYGCGAEKFPSKSKWLNKIREDLPSGVRSLYGPAAAPADAKDLPTVLFDEGRFPDHARFEREE